MADAANYDMTEPTSLERLLKYDRVITLAGLIGLCGLSWLYIVRGAGLDMSAWNMTALVLFPNRQTQEAMPAMPGMVLDASAADWMPWGFATSALMVAMWWVMMVAMMIPSAAPTILLYAQVHRGARARRRFHGTGSTDAGELGPTGATELASSVAFAAGYVIVWLGFSVGAAALQWMLERVGLVSAMMMGSRSRWLSGGILIVAGLYQLSPLKNHCLAHCRSPASFLARYWRPHALGALQLGLRHGAHCVGCCWMLMALLFVGGVMNLIWIAALAIIVLTEKLLPRGRWIGRSAGVALTGWGIATFVV
jgi:predicted metal-binding membrane protein